MPDVQQTVETILEVKDRASSSLAQISKIADSADKNLGKLEKSAKAVGISTKQATPGFGGLAASMGGVQRAGMGLKMMFFELAAAVGVATGVKSLFTQFVDSNSEAEEASRKLGATISGLYKIGGEKDPIKNLRLSMERGAEMVDHFSEVSFKLGIPEEQLQNMAKSMLPAVASAGKGTSDLLKLTEDLAIVARATGKGFEETAQNVKMAVEFGVARKGTFLSEKGITSKQLQGWTKAQRMAKVMSAIKLMRPEELVKIQTYSDLVSMVKTRFAEMTETAGKPLFEAAKVKAKELADWIEKNRKKIEATGKLIADKFVSGLNTAVELVQSLYRHWDEVRAVVIAIAAVMAVHKTATWAKGFASGLKDAIAGSRAGIGSIGKLAALGMAAEALMIGIAIGTAISDYLQTTKWFKDFMDARVAGARTPAQVAADEAHAVEKVRTAKMEAALARDQMKSGKDAFTFYSDLHEQLRKGENVFAMFAGAGNTEHLKVGFADLAEFSKKMKLVPDALVAPASAKDKDKSKAPNYDFRNSRFDITQTFAEGFDPDRIAVAFTDDLVSLGEMRSQSGFTPIGAVR